LTRASRGASVQDVNASPIRTRRWTRAEYYRLDELGIVHPTERLELVGGQIVVKERQSPAHATAIRLAREAFEHAFGPGWDVRTRAPITLDEESEPEPDMAVVPGGPRDYLAAHPSCPPLVLEVAEATLAFDRDHKSSLYARAQIPDYWLVNLPDRVLHVYRDPALDADAPYGWQYATALILGGGDFVTPLASSSARILVADLLP
jgi:Uma2 family endonuclease